MLLVRVTLHGECSVSRITRLDDGSKAGGCCTKARVTPRSGVLGLIECTQLRFAVSESLSPLFDVTRLKYELSCIALTGVRWRSCRMGVGAKVVVVVARLTVTSNENLGG